MQSIKIRASQAYRIITEPKSKLDKEQGNLSETAKTYLHELWLYNNYGYKDELYTNEIQKGRLNEDLATTLIQNVLGGELRIINKNYYSNDYISGTPDIILNDCIEDVKNSFSVKTFHNSEITPAYYWQAQCYMELLNINNYRLIYCLTQTPDNIITDLKKRLYYQFDCDETNEYYINASTQIDINHNIYNIDQKYRVKLFNIEYNKNDIIKLYAKCEKAIEYYNNIKL